MASQSQTIIEEQRKLSEAQERYRSEQQAESSTTLARSVTAIAKDESKPSALGFWKIALAVFAGNVMTGIMAAIIYEISH